MKPVMLAACLVLTAFARLDAEPPVTAIVNVPRGLKSTYAVGPNLITSGWGIGEKSSVWQHKIERLHDLAMSADAKFLVAAGGSQSESGTVVVYSWPEREELARHVVPDDVAYAISWSSDGKLLAVAHGEEVSVIDPFAKSMSDAFHLRGHSKMVTGVAFLPGTHFVVSTARDQTLRVWDVDKGKLVRSLGNHTRAINGLAVQPGERKLPVVATVGGDRTLRFWQPTIGRMMRFVRLDSEPLAVVFTADGRFAAVCCADGAVRLIDPETAKVLATKPAIDGWAYALVEAPLGGKTFIVGGQDAQLEWVHFD